MTPYGGRGGGGGEQNMLPASADTTMMGGYDDAEQQHQTYDTENCLQLAQGTVLEACHNVAGDVLATASSDDVVQIWASRPCGWHLLHTEQLTSHPTRLAWAHPQYGQLLAVGTTTGSVYVLQGPRSAGQLQQAKSKAEQQPARAIEAWCRTTQLECGNTAVSALTFAPHQHGLVLAAACGRQQAPGLAQANPAGKAHVQLWEAGQATSAQWTLVSSIQVPEAAGICHCLCWHEATPGLPPLLLGGHDDGGSIWGYHSSSMTWQVLANFAAPADAPSSTSTLSVHWAPTLGRPYELVAASFGSAVVLYKVQQSRGSSKHASQGSEQQQQQQQSQLGQLEVLPLQQLTHPAPVWRLAFNMMGTSLACSLDDRPEVWLWLEMMDGAWAAVSKIAGTQQQHGGSGSRGAADGVGDLVD